MEYTKIDLETYPRARQFAYFRDMACPAMGATVPVDITGRPEAWKSGGLPFFLTFLYAVSAAANDVPELRRRILDGGIVEFAHCGTTHTVALEDGTYGYCSLETELPFPAYLAAAAAAQERTRSARCFEEADDVLSRLFISTLPWLSYTALVQPMTVPADSNPRITWGRYFTQEGRTLIPVTLLCHHALVDGLHLARFFERLQVRLGEL